MRILVQGSLALILPAVLMLLAGCGPAGELRPGGRTAEGNVGADNNGGQVELEPGQILVLALDSNPSTGYGWEVVEANDSVLRQMGESEFEFDSDLGSPAPGMPGEETFRFEAVKTGETPLKLIYHQSWEKGVEPKETYSIQVVVR